MTKPSPRISLLHATYRREGGPLEVKRAWLDAAADPSTIEYVFAMDDDDVDSLRATVEHLRVVNPGGLGVVTSVRNWNAAAAIATGDLLVVVADDLFPPQGWDVALQELIGDLDARRLAFAVKLADSPADISGSSPLSGAQPRLLRHPVVSRAFYAKMGLFSPKFNGLYCDDDITRRAFWKAVILDGRTIRLDHRHPSFDRSRPMSDSQQLVNAANEHRQGSETLNDLWPRWRRDAPILLLEVGGSCRLTDRYARVLSHWLRLRSVGNYLRKRAKAAILLILHPKRLAARVRR